MIPPFIKDWADNLETEAYLRYQLGDLKISQALYAEALPIRQRLADDAFQVHGPALAGLLSNLGNLLQASGELPAARAKYQEALEIDLKVDEIQGENYAPFLGHTYHNLATVLHTMGDLEGAKDAIKKALTIRRRYLLKCRRAYRLDLAHSLNTLGLIQRGLGRLTGAFRSFKRAVALCDEAAGQNPNACLEDRWHSWANLGELYRATFAPLGWPDLHEARRALGTARQYAEKFRARSASEVYRRQVSHETLLLYESLVRTCVEIWERFGEEEALREAVEVAEASRSRGLLDLLADELLTPLLPPGEEKLLADFREARRRLVQIRKQLELEERSNRAFRRGDVDHGDIEGDFPALRFNPDANHSQGSSQTLLPPPASGMRSMQVEAERAEAEYADVLRKIRRYAPEFDPDQPVSPISFGQALDLIPDNNTALVEYSLTREGGFALIITRRGISAVPLPDCKDQNIRELEREWSNYCKHPDLHNDASAVERKRATDDWMRVWREDVPRMLAKIAKAAIHCVLRDLADTHQIHPVAEEKDGQGNSDERVPRLVICPNRWLHVFPLHACPMANDVRPVSDGYEIVYTPSLSLLHRCRHMERQQSDLAVLVHPPAAELVFSQAEAERLKRRYRRLRVFEQSETERRDEIIETAALSLLFLYTGHASFNREDPLDAALHTGGENYPELWLTLRRVFAQMNLRRNRLTVINGCQSGLLKPDRVDEYVSFPTGFLYAGSTCVISALWVVHDISGALLMDRCHKELLAGVAPAAALRKAQRWLRHDIHNGHQLCDEVVPEFLDAIRNRNLREQCLAVASEYANDFPDSPPFASPFHWAAFTAAGMAYPLHKLA